MKYLLALIILVPTYLSAQKKAEITNTYNATTAVIQYDSVLTKLKDYNSQTKILEAYQKQLQSEYDFKKLELETKIKDYGDKEKNLTEEQKKQTMEGLQKQNDELTALLQESQKKFQQKQQELLQPMNEKIKKAIEIVAQKNGYSFITEKNNFYYASPNSDVTNQVIEEANKLN
jgi:outer membrane protein